MQTPSSPPLYLNEELKEVVDDFVYTARQHCQNMEQIFLQLCEVKDGQSLIQEAFRHMHTIKGNAAFLGLAKLELLAHKAENVLDASLKVGGTHSSIMAIELLSVVNGLRRMLDHFETHHQEDETSLGEQIERLRALEAMQSKKKITSGYLRIGDILQQLGHITQQDVKDALDSQRAGDPRRLGDILVDKGRIDTSRLWEARRFQQRQSSRMVQLNSVQLRYLEQHVEDLSQGWSSLCSGAANINDLKQSMQFWLLELQNKLSLLHLKPLRDLWGRVARHAHRMAAKQDLLLRVDIQQDGDLMLDEEHFEKLQDVMLHLVNNSIIHAFASRQEAEEDARRVNVLSLRLEDFQGHQSLMLGDDGHGIDLEDIAQKARAKGVAPNEEPSLDWIFLPNISTHANVDQLAGRGVGMDVVAQNMKDIGGNVRVASTLGEGTRFWLILPPLYQ